MKALSITDLVYRWPGQSAACLDMPHFAVDTGYRLTIDKLVPYLPPKRK